MLFLGYDVGSSSMKACLLDGDTGTVVVSATSPPTDLAIQSPRQGWAEQDPRLWGKHSKGAAAKLLDLAAVDTARIGGIGIGYQMHWLVMVDRRQHVLHPAIIWCDARAVDIGARAFKGFGMDFCLQHYLNSLGNFIAS